MLSKEKIEELKERLTVTYDEVTYTPELFLRKEFVPQLAIVYIIFNKRYTFTVPLFLFENVDISKSYESAQEEFIREVNRNVRLAHRREVII